MRQQIETLTAAVESLSAMAVGRPALPESALEALRCEQELFRREMNGTVGVALSHSAGPLVTAPPLFLGWGTPIELRAEALDAGLRGPAVWTRVQDDIDALFSLNRSVQGQLAGLEHMLRRLAVTVYGSTNATGARSATMTSSASPARSMRPTNTGIDAEGDGMAAPTKAIAWVRALRNVLFVLL